MQAKQSEPRPDLSALFDVENYLYFYDELYHSEECTELEVAFLRTHLKLSVDKTLLDLGCGFGRHAMLLARNVKSLVGIDQNSRYVEMAKTAASQANLKNASFLACDIFDYHAPLLFDRIILLNTIFGLFSDRDNERLLRMVNACLNENGLFCFDVINRDAILVGLQHHDVVEKEGNLLIDRLEFEPKSGRMFNDRLYCKAGSVTAAPFSLRLYNYTELEALLRLAGFEIVQAYADWRGSPFGTQSKRIVVVATKLRGHEVRL